MFFSEKEHKQDSSLFLTGKVSQYSSMPFKIRKDHKYVLRVFRIDIDMFRSAGEGISRFIILPEAPCALGTPDGYDAYRRGLISQPTHNSLVHIVVKELA